MRRVRGIFNAIQHAERAVLVDDFSCSIEKVGGGNGPKASGLARLRTMIEAFFPKQGAHRVHVRYNAGLKVANQHFESKPALDAIEVDMWPRKFFFKSVRHVHRLFDIVVKSDAVLIVQVKDCDLSSGLMKQREGAVGTESIAVNSSVQGVSAMTEAGKGIERVACAMTATGYARRFAQGAHA